MRAWNLWLAGAGLATLVVTGCNSVLGISDVSRCDVDAEFAMITSSQSPASLRHRSSDNGPSLLFLLNTDTMPDSLSVELYNNLGGHGALDVPGQYTLTAEDAKLETCGICISVNADFDSSADTFAQTYFALTQGSFSLTQADSTGMSGQLQDLAFRHVELSGGVTTDVGDNCDVTVQDVQFAMAYSQ